jgi:tRNA (guanine-N7-)-methyltransferase
MPRKKLERFKHNALADNVIEEGKDNFYSVRKNWNLSYFHNNNPIVLELACGRGEYTTGLAKLFPEKNFIGIDIKGARIWKGSAVALENNLKNVCFYRATIDFIDDYFDENEVSEIWITFPDPRPKEKDEKRRLVNERYLHKYKKILKPGGVLHLKTDNVDFFNYGLQELKKINPSQINYTYDLYHSDLINEHYGIITKYEQKFLSEGKKINYWKVIL